MAQPISAQPEFISLTPLKVLVRCGGSNVVALPDVGGAIGTEFSVVDNVGIASNAAPITITVTLFNGVTSVVITSAGGLFRFTWTGNFYAMG